MIGPGPSNVPGRGAILRMGGLASLALASSIGAAGCEPAATETPRPAVVRLVNAPPGTFAEQLARQYSKAGGTLDVRVQETVTDPYEAILRGDADITLNTADSAYFAYRRAAGGSREPARLRAVATLEVIPLHLVVSRSSGISDASSLVGHTVGVPARLPMIELLLRVFQLTGAVRRVTLTSAGQVAPLMRSGAIDAFILLGYNPNPEIETALRSGARLVSIDGPEVSRLLDEYPFVRLSAIPAHTYTGQSEPVHTIGVDLLYVCRGDLNEFVVYELTRKLFEALPALSKSFPALRAFDVKQSAATIIPLHDGAARYYRSVEVLP